jgi:ABC-type antimicrobial peptide transport system permease subunit
MLQNYLKVAWRNVLKSKVSSFINISGLAAGMAIAMLIGLWIWDELSFNKSFKNYDRIAQVLTNSSYNGGIGTDYNTAPPYGDELRNSFGTDFKHVLMTSRPFPMVLSSGEKNLMKTGYYFEPGITDMLNLKMLKGSRNGLKDPSSILLSASVATAFFGTADPMGKVMKIDNKENVVITGVYEDLPYNTDFADMEFVAPWQLYIMSAPWIRKDNWEQDGFQTYVQIADNADMNEVSNKIRNLKLNRIDKEKAKSNPQVFLLPMSKFHLYSDFDNGVAIGRNAQFVWMYGIIGVCVLLLACINFMNLATARSEKRAKEVGIRKTIGSLRIQLIKQFLTESLLVVCSSFLLSLIVAQLMLPLFNEVAGKKMVLPWNNVFFWLTGWGISLVTGFIAGSYPAFYLSSFQPVKVLKGVFKAARSASIPRKALVVLQFTVSIILIIGVIIIYRQIQLGKSRPVGYQREGLMTVTTPTDEIHDHFAAVRNELKESGAVVEIAETVNPVTMLGFSGNGFQWDNRPIDENFWIGKAYITPEYGKTIGWQIIQGRDLSRSFATDSAGVILNQSMVKYMGVKNPVGMTIKETLFGKTSSYTVVGVVRDMLMQSPYNPVKETVYIADNEKTHYVAIRLNPLMNVNTATGKIEATFKKFAPNSPFEYSFVDNEYERKFGDEERISKLASVFAILAIFISCLGLFGMASFIAEQRTKEIGVRKVLGATVISLWGQLSKGFVILVSISFLIASPIALYFMHNWLQNYQYRTELSWWIFALAGLLTVGISLITVSYQALKAAIANPVKSLRTE